MKYFIFTLFLCPFLCAFSQKKFISAYSSVNLNSITEIDSNKTKFGDRLNLNFGIEYRRFVSPKFFINAKAGINTQKDRIVNSFQISNNNLNPIGIRPVGEFKYLHSSLSFGYRQYWGISEADYTYVTTGIASNFLISAYSKYDSIHSPLEKKEYEIVNARQLDITIVGQGGRNLSVGEHLNLDLSFGFTCSLLSLYKKGSFKETKPVPRHFGAMANIGIQYIF